MSNEPKLDQVDESTETENTEQSSEATTLSRAERRRQNSGSKQPAKGTGNAAPENLFTKPATATTASNPERVAIIKQQIEQFVNNCGKTKGISKEVRQGSAALVLAVRNLVTLEGADLKTAFTYFYKAIKECENGAFDKGLIYRFVDAIESKNDRNGFVKFTNLMVKYARLEDPTSIHNSTDVEYSLSFIKNKTVQKQLAGLFAK